MSYAQFGYSYHPASQILVGGQTGSTTVTSNPCCESGRAMVTDPVTGQAVFSCQQCDSHSLVYPRLGSSVPTSPYAPYSDQSYPAVGMESPTFYSSLGTPYVLKEGNSEVPGWQSMAQPTGYYPYDPSLAAYGYGYDLNGARRKNATREATTTLKTWLNDHKKNPYPTKGEKIMLAIITKMTLTQVSTWFANARRRLKKENKITWSAKGKEEDDDDDGKLSDVDDDKESSSDRLDGSSSDGTSGKLSDAAFEKSSDGKESSCNQLLTGSASGGMMTRLPCDPASMPTTSSPAHHLSHQMSVQQTLPRYTADMHRLKSCTEMEKDILQGGNVIHSGTSLDAAGVASLSQNKPKIWSLADTATCKTPTTSSMALGGSPRPNCGTMTTGAAMIPSWTSGAPNQRQPLGLSHSLPPFQVTSHTGSYGSPYHSTSGVPLPPLPQTKTTAVAAPSHHSATMANNSGCDVVNGTLMASRTPGGGGGQCSNNAFSELQTDTPPQTPPNHKFPSVPHYSHHGVVSGQQGSGYNNGDHYIGQRTLLSSVNARLREFQGP